MKNKQTKTVHIGGLKVLFRFDGDKIEGTDVRLAKKHSARAHERETRWVKKFLQGKNPRLPLNRNRLTSFQKKVFGVAEKIPVGKTLTYGEVARKIRSPRGARAVGQALRRNPFPLFIPCHRVVAKDGIGGFGGKKHSALKQFLINLERSQT